MSVNEPSGDSTRLTDLTAVSPVDGRYARHTAPLRNICSEFALIRYRLSIELRWLQALGAEPGIVDLANFDANATSFMTQIADAFDETEARRIKTIEATTNHDVKAVEYYLREKFDRKDTLQSAIPFIHFACTSEDINNLAYALMLQDARDKTILPALNGIVDELRTLATAFAGQAMLSRTHGQTASPTTMGKELSVFAARLKRQATTFSDVAVLGKINGAVGNYNAHLAAYPNVDWQAFSKGFVTDLGLDWNPHTTQIEPHDWIAEYADALARANTILIDLCRDIWSYVSIGYFVQQQVAEEVGSSTMPHKVNPIDFENAEGNLGVANALLNHFSRKLPISRLQRDLTDSTVLRNIGAALAYTLIACCSLRQGLSKLELDDKALARDLDQAWEVLAEPVQTVMRRYGINDSYEQLKELTRGRPIDQASLVAFIDQLDIPADVKTTLKALRPSTYIGVAAELAKDV